MSDIEQKFNELMERRTQLQQEIDGMTKQLFSEMCVEFFDSFPEVISFSWVQYTPYFNDGEPCVFHANTDEIQTLVATQEIGSNAYDEYDEHNNQYTYTYVYAYKESPVFNIIQKFRSILSRFDDDMLQDMFGEGEIVVTRDGVNVEDYDHS